MPNIQDCGVWKRSVVLFIWGLIVLQPSRAAETDLQSAASVRDYDVAARHLTAMRGELILLSKTHPVLRGIEKDRLRDPASGFPVTVCSEFNSPTTKLSQLVGDTDCGLSFGRNLVMGDFLEMSFPVPQRNGVCIDVVVSASPGVVRHLGGADESWELEKGEARLTICHRLMIGKELKNLEIPIREILHRNLQALQDEIQQKCGWVAKDHWSHERDNDTPRDDGTIIPTKTGVGLIVVGLAVLVFLGRRRARRQRP